jgi:hypothetical protein
VVAVGITTSVPVAVFVPLQPPEALQEVASVEVHVKEEDCPTARNVGSATKETVGAGEEAATVTVAELVAVPPVPLQAKV